MKHRIVTAAQMKEIEQAGDAHGLPYLQMMENAGLAAYAELQKQFSHPGRLLVVCGKGNNGGDGFVVARAAAKDGWNVTVFLAEGEPKTADAIRNFERLHSLPVHICADGSVLETQSFAAVVDALYGTGFHGELRPSGLAACGLIRRLHKSGAFVLAVDLPSGINTDTGEVAEGAAHADLTVTFDSYKPLHIAEASAPLCGKIVCADIGIRDAAAEKHLRTKEPPHNSLCGGSLALSTGGVTSCAQGSAGTAHTLPASPPADASRFPAAIQTASRKRLRQCRR